MSSSRVTPRVGEGEGEGEGEGKGEREREREREGECEGEGEGEGVVPASCGLALYSAVVSAGSTRLMTVWFMP